MIHIILPFYNRINVTQSFLDALNQQTYTSFRLIGVDDGSTDGSREMIKAKVEDLVLLKGDGSLWWGGSLQLAYSFLKTDNRVNPHDLVLIINDDVIIESSFLESAVRELERKEKTLLLSSCFDQSSGKHLDSGISIDWKRFLFRKPTDNEPVNCFSTRGLFLKASDYLSLGGFYPKLLPHYGSDYEYTIRAKRRGYSLVTSENVRLFLNTETTGFHEIKESSFYNFLVKYFSKKNPNNPFYQSSLVLLAWPCRYIPAALLLITKRSLGTIMRGLFSMR